MKTKIIFATVFAVSFAIAGPVSAQVAAFIKTGHQNKYLNSGVGNGAEWNGEGLTCELCDLDPGNSQLNNRAGHNKWNPQSARGKTDENDNQATFDVKMDLGPNGGGKLASKGQMKRSRRR